MADSQQCRACNRLLPLEDFRIVTKNKNGRSLRCRSCFKVGITAPSPTGIVVPPPNALKARLVAKWVADGMSAAEAEIHFDNLLKSVGVEL